VSTIPHEARTSVRASTTPRPVVAARRLFRPMPRSVMRHRAGSLRNGGITRSATLRPPRPGWHLAPQRGHRGLVLAAAIVGAAVATSPVATASTSAMTTVSQWNR
jgi:hypothetical protein